MGKSRELGMESAESAPLSPMAGAVIQPGLLARLEAILYGRFPVLQQYDDKDGILYTQMRPSDSPIKSAGSCRFETRHLLPIRRGYRKTMCGILVILTVIAASFWSWPAWAMPRKTTRHQDPLSFSAKGEFQISIFEDLHFGESKALSLTAWK